MTLDELKALIAAKHNPSLKDQVGSVFEIWEDGEVTMTKSGDLFGQRNLHQMTPPLDGIDPSLIMDFFPNQHGNGHTSAFVTPGDAKIIRAAICDHFKVVDKWIGF